MTVFLHWRDHTFPAGDGEHANTRRAPYHTQAEALEQAAHDLAFNGAEVAHLFNDKGKDVLDRKKLVARAVELAEKHYAPLAGGLPESEFASRVAAAKTDIEKRAA